MTDRRPHDDIATTPVTPIELAASVRAAFATPMRMSMIAARSREMAAGGQLELGDIEMLANAPLRMTMSRLEGAR